ncbi:MAG TPA: hypothetical protein VN695_12525 [Streptosporangiaceae bacterium]|nr:hypothetical protein [Streptosporangiaceae bacterium]
MTRRVGSLGRGAWLTSRNTRLRQGQPGQKEIACFITCPGAGPSQARVL